MSRHVALAGFPRSAARAIAALLGAGLALGVVLLAAICVPGPPDESLYRFEVFYVVPPERPEHRCGTCAGGGPECEVWRQGEPEDLAALDLARAAADSLVWFERSPGSVAWRGDPTARLRLVYPSGARSIEAEYAAGAGLDWAGQLAEWLERFPPGLTAVGGADERPYCWTIELGERGRIRGAAASEVDALGAMRALSAELASWPALARARFELTALVRRSAHELDVFPVEVESVARLDELPHLLREERARWRRE